MGEQLADDLPDPVDTREREVVDEGDRPPVALLGHHGSRGISLPFSRVAVGKSAGGPADVALLRVRASINRKPRSRLVVWSQRLPDVVMVVRAHDLLDDLHRPSRGIGWRQGRRSCRYAGLPEAVLH